MNVKELLLVVGAALITTWTIDYLFFNKKLTPEEVGVKSGQSFVAPKTRQESKPLNVEVDFIEAKRPSRATITSIETNHALLDFSTDAASLERLEFKRQIDGYKQTITTLFPVNDTEREKRCFLVALNDETPYYYELINQKDSGTTVELTYQAEVTRAKVVKKFTVYKDSFKIDLAVTITPKGSNPVQARIFYPAPIMPYMADDYTSGLANDDRGSIVIIQRAKIDPNMYWHEPSFFGSDDRYFVHAMITDPSHFTQRAYFRLSGQQELCSILEGSEITQETSWTVSFYCGPKEEQAMVAVDPRLEQTLGYAGWFAPIARWLLKLLTFLYSYLGNYGLAIIALTILTKIVLLPFALQSAQSMKKHNEVQRKLKYIQQKYKDDPETLNRERAEIMRAEGLSSMAGCLPLLLQLPIFLALSRVLSTSIELYQAPFYGWITDLSARDPYYVLPILTGLVMLLQATTVDPKQRIQLICMALVFAAFTASLSAGLVLYIFMSTLLGVIQTVVQQKLKWV